MTRCKVAVADNTGLYNRIRRGAVGFEQSLVADIEPRKVGIDYVVNQISAVVQLGPVEELLAVGSGADSCCVPVEEDMMARSRRLEAPFYRQSENSFYLGTQTAEVAVRVGWGLPSSRKRGPAIWGRRYRLPPFL